MARKSTKATEAAVTPENITPEEATLLALADLIYAALGHSGAVAATENVEPAEGGVTAAADEDEAEEDAPEVEEADEVDADDEVDIDAEREELMALSIAEVRKRLVAQGFDKEDVKAEKSKAALVDNLLDDLYGDEEDDEDPEEEPEDAEDEDVEETDAEDDADEDEPEDDEDESDDDDEDEEGDEEEPYTEDELSDMSLAELKDIATEWELEIPKGARSKTYIKAILEAQEAEEDEDADDAEDEGEEDERGELEALTLPELRKRAKDDYGLTAREIKGLDKDAILDLIFEDDEDA